MKGHRPRIMICFSEKMCSCCLVSTMCFLRRHLRAKVLEGSDLIWTWVREKYILYPEWEMVLSQLQNSVKKDNLLSLHVLPSVVFAHSWNIVSRNTGLGLDNKLTSSTLPNPPIPRVSTHEKSLRVR